VTTQARPESAKRVRAGHLAQELAHAWRRLRRAPAFSVSVVVLLALGIGGLAAVASAGWSLFIRPLPYAEPDRLVTVSAYYRRIDAHMGLSAALVEQLNREANFGTLAIVERGFRLELDDGTGVRAARIDHRLLPTLGIAPLAGRGFTGYDVGQRSDRVALISDRLRRARFAGDEPVVGRRLELRDGQVRIIGVLPDRLAAPETGTDIWLPMDLGPDTLAPGNRRHLVSHTVIARLPGGSRPDRYRARLLARIANDPEIDSRLGSDDDLEFMVRPLRERWAHGQREGLLILAAATALVLVGAWMNLAGLWLARWTGRTRELAIRFALGARTRQATIGVVFEYLLLGIPGLALALAVAVLGIDLLYSLGVLDENGPLRAGVALPTVGFGLAMLALGAVPLLITLRAGARRLSTRAAGNLGGKGTDSGTGRAGLRRVLLIGQIGIAFSLLMSLALLLASWTRLLNEDLGFDSGKLVAAMISAPRTGIGDRPPVPGPDAKVAAVVDRIRALPGVEAASWSNTVPFGGLEFVSGYFIDDRPDEAVPARRREVGPDFFRVAGIDLRSGRVFGPEDAGGNQGGVIVDRAFEEKYLNGSALGRRVGYPLPDRTVVGVVSTVRHESPDEPPGDPALYTHSPEPLSQTQLLVRTPLDPDSLIDVIRETLAQSLGAERVSFVSSLDARVRHSVREREPQLILISAFAVLAILLVFYGLYALQSYQVAIRVAEIGLRRAIGASTLRILGAELVRAAWLIPPGLMFGAAGAWLGARLISVHLYETGLDDPVLWLATAVAIASTILLAGLAPAVRASRIEPMDALIHE